MKTPLLLILLMLATGLTLHAQVGINADGSQPDPRTMLDVKSTSKGVLLPRLTETERNTLNLDVPDGMLIFNTTASKLQIFMGNKWYSITMDAGEEIPLTDADGNTYPTVEIGSQTWMDENLRTTKYNDGTSIQKVEGATEWTNLTTGSYAIYPHTSIEGINSDAEVLQAYGALYNWYAVNTGNLCPMGWHIPSNAEWTTLSDFIGGSDIGNQLKSCRQVNSPLGGDCTTSEHPRWDLDNTHYGTDAFNFSAFPGGYRGYNGGFGGVSGEGTWWCSTEDDVSNAWHRRIDYSRGDVISNSLPKNNGFSIRCIKD